MSGDLVRITETSDFMADALREELVDLNPMEQRIVVSRILKRISDLVPLAKPSASATDELMKPMDENEARRYGQTSLKFGKYRGVPIADVSRSYLAWLADESDKTYRLLTRYLNSDKVQHERRVAEAVYEDDEEEYDE